MQWQFAAGGSNRIAERQRLLDEFLTVMFGRSDSSILISDATTLSALLPDGGATAVHNCALHYGILLRPTDLDLPLWELLDRLALKRP